MTTATSTSKPKQLAYASSKGAPEPDDFRMTLGEHLEELRFRLILALLGFAVAVAVCLVFGDKVVWYFCRPLVYALEANKLPATVFAKEASEAFSVYIKISLVTALAFASPWLLYQIWQFVAAGLYPHERKYITRYLPLSITLLIAGMLFLYFLVLPLMLKFFIGFGIGPAVPSGPPAVIDPKAPVTAPVLVPTYNGDPAHPIDGQIWVDGYQRRLKVCFEGATRVIPFGSNDLVTYQITLSEYIDTVVELLLSFGLAFQMPLVVLALVRIGIVDVATLKKSRRYVYFVIFVAAAFIIPDVVGGMIALAVPLCGLFELGLWLARDPKAKRARA